ncbi:hypothetical protein [Prescottella equi]|uniref:hypothetical protein n=1 Tax=Rhodococcus hoagii TaxID=43767 RepID=UPI000A0FB064|nr:hypothetical protein [Prescottella equi]ORM00695.1 hypothetical protein A5N69_07065 [Prescottella equi]ORM21564.1 hypothetical protein A5N74_01630 [Prescottella equi]
MTYRHIEADLVGMLGDSPPGRRRAGYSLTELAADMPVKQKHVRAAIVALEQRGVVVNVGKPDRPRYALKN